MEAKDFEARKKELVNECDVAPQVWDRVMPRLERFMEPFVDSLVRREQIECAGTFVRGLISDLEHKNTESIAYRFEQERMPLQWFIGVSPWDDAPLRDELVRQVGGHRRTALVGDGVCGRGNDKQHGKPQRWRRVTSNRTPASDRPGRVGWRRGS